MTQLKKHAFVFVLASLLFNSKAQDNKSSFSLQEAIDYAIKHSPNFLNAELDEKSADYRRKEIAGLGLPQVKGSFDVKNYIEIPTSLIPAAAFNPAAPADAFAAVKFGTKYNSTAGISASQLIFSSDYIFGLKASKEFMSLAKINVNRTKVQLVSEVSKAYFAVLTNKDKIKLLDANTLRLKKILDDTKALNEKGFAELIEVERIQVAYNNLNTEMEKLQKLIHLSESILKFQMGYDLSAKIELSESLEQSTIDDSELSLQKINVQQNPDYQVVMAQKSLLDIDVKRHQWGYLPTIAAYGAYNLNRQGNKLDLFQNDATDPTKTWFKIALIGITMDVNIFDGFQRHNRIQQAKIEALKISNALRNIELGSNTQANVSASTYNIAYSELQNQKRNMKLAEHVVEVTQKKYLSGLGNNMEVVNAETDLKIAQTNYYNAIYEMLIAKIDYQKATGTLVK